MAVAFSPGQTLGRRDLDIFLSNTGGNAANAYNITYAIYYVDPSDSSEVLIGSATRTPVNPAVGEYYASLQVPSTSTAGDYRVRWTINEFSGSPSQQVVQEWAVVASSALTATSYSTSEQAMIDKLRILLRDNNPDKNYHFRPPEHEGDINAYNQVFGFVWEDSELIEYINMALDMWNMSPPETESLSTIDKLLTQKTVWKTPVLWGAVYHALLALAINWVHDEFDYSIGGVSLSIEKSSKYESLKQNAEGQFEKAQESKARTTKYLRGLRQPRFGAGARSSFGPYTGRNVMSPRNFVVFMLGLGYPLWEALSHVSHLPSLLA